jgi:transposase
MLKQLHVLAFLGLMDRKTLATFADVCPKTVTAVKKRYAQVGLEGILHPNRYRPKSALEPYKKNLKASFRKKVSPSMAEAAERVERLTGVRLGVWAVREHLKSIGLRFRCLGHVPAKADVAEQLRFEWEELEPRLKECREGKRHVFFLDAAHFVLAAFLCSVWCFVRTFVKSPSGRQRYNVLGALHALTRQLEVFTNVGYINSESIVAFLTQLKAKYNDLPITIFLDNARYQRCLFVQNFAQSIGIELVFLPSYSPNLNLIERVWKILRKKALNGKYYANFALFRSAIDNSIEEFNQEDHSKTLSHKFQRFEKGRL